MRKKNDRQNAEKSVAEGLQQKLITVLCKVKIEITPNFYRALNKYKSQEKEKNRNEEKE